MKKSALIVTSLSHYKTAQETLRVQDVVAALRRNGWVVDVLTPVASPILAATLAHDVRVFTIPRILMPFRRMAVFLQALALASKRDYTILHGIDEGAGIVRAVNRLSLKKFAYIAEIHHPKSAGKRTLEHASAVIVSNGDILSRLNAGVPVARTSILPDPHAELVDNAFTTAEFSDAIDGIYTYVLRTNPELLK
ncbi:MAG: glycosyltransferase [Kiritimatiellae bacterium]|nr:glycosyltransferase [Kiritimatiellia bacterium]